MSSTGLRVWVAYWAFMGAGAVAVVLVTDQLVAEALGLLCFAVCVAAIVRALSLQARSNAVPKGPADD